MLRAAAEQDGIVELGERFDGRVDATWALVTKVTPSARIWAMRRSRMCFSSLKLGMP